MWTEFYKIATKVRLVLVRTTIRMKNVAAPKFRRPIDVSSPLFEKAGVEQSVAVCFRNVAALYPERLAIRGLHQQYSFDRLNRTANRVAHAVLKAEKKPEGQVGVLAIQETGIVAILGVLKAGKTYVPLDPSFPPAKLSPILDECEIDTIVTENKYLPLAQTLS